ncbi:MAG: oligosaccharide flippase family protein [Deltaproteobacteria bacterium]|nr:oligosaccharide flippase family protein [Deltaproteobacteria bacterium]
MKLLAGFSKTSLGRLLLRGAGGSLGVTVAGMALAMGLQLLLARLLGTEHYGVYAYSLSIVSLLVLAARMGMDTAAVRFVSQYGAAKDWNLLRGFLRWAHLRVLGVALGLGVLLVSVAWLFRQSLSDGLPSTLAWGSLLIPCLGLLGLRKGALQGLRRVALGQIPEQVVRPVLLGCLLGLFFWLVGRSPQAPEAMALATLAALLATLAAGWLLKSNLPLEVKEAAPSQLGRKWLGVSLPLWLVAGLRQILHQTDILLVGALLGTTEAGIYGVATRLAPLVALGLNAVNSIAAPLISELYAQQRHRELQTLVTQAAWAASLASLPLGLGLVLFRHPVLSLFGEDFRRGAPVVVILCLAQLVNAFTGPVGWLLNMTGHQKVNARILSWITGLNLLLNLPAILWLGLPGAALVTGGLQAVKNLWTWFEVRRRLGVNSSILPGSGMAI